jgi:hypothetical protein
LYWLELHNKLLAFQTFKYVDVGLELPRTAAAPLEAWIDKASQLDPYASIWAMEGLGRYYADRVWEHGGIPSALLTADVLRDLPVRSLLPLHTGMGLAFAERLVRQFDAQGSEKAVRTMLQQFIDLGRQNARRGYLYCTLEALGLIMRFCAPQLVPVADRQLAAMAPDVLGLFWHGLGRGLYFLPLNLMPSARSFQRALEMSQAEPPHALGRRNALAGLAWALTLVNIRHPQILESVVKAHGATWCSEKPFSNGVGSALMIWYDMQGDDLYLDAFRHYQPEPSDLALVQNWHRWVREPCRTALQCYDNVVQQHGIGEVFRCQSFAPWYH